MTASTRRRIPENLHRYIVQQNYELYTPEDQAVWRYIMRQLKNFLAVHAHPIYLEGLQKTGLHVDSIPRIDEVDAQLEKLGWGAVPVSGFIPPAAFMEFQSIGVLPIACDMRSLDHLLYTPAPDIVHEAAGHAPILVDPKYAAYLRQYGEVARRSIISKEDLAQYEAIRVLSDMKEDPASTPTAIAIAEAELEQINRTMKHVSEAALLSRMNWWTAEYGLIKDGKETKIFGAGLLSSVGEARACLSTKVDKIPLSVDCVNFSYDITEPQPQLFVTEDFAQLGSVLEDLATRLAFRRGGVYGLERAVEAATVNTVQLNSGIQISGILKDFVRGKDGSSVYLRFSGPCQLAYAEHELAEQGTEFHKEGFSTPVGRARGFAACLSSANVESLRKQGLKPGERGRIAFESGVEVEGRIDRFGFEDGKLILISWQDCRVVLGNQLLFDPAWGTFDMAVGLAVTSVFGGPADRSRFGATEDFVAKRIPERSFSSTRKARHDLYHELRGIRAKPQAGRAERLLEDYLAQSNPDWLMGVELLEIGFLQKFPEEKMSRLRQHLISTNFSDLAVQECVRDGIALADRAL